jgi:integrase
MENRFHFTKTAIAGLTPPADGKRLTFYDETVPKLALRMTAAGTKTFYIIKRAGSSMAWVKLGVFPDMPVEVARKEAQSKLGQFANGDNPAETRRRLKAEPTLTEFFKEYGERHGSKKKSWADDQQRYRSYLEKPLGSKKLSDITRESVGRILSDMEAAGKAGATINNVRALASGLFGKAMEWSYLTINPVKGIKTRKATKRDRFLQAHELPRFFVSVGQEANDTIRDFFLLSLLTGARRANVLAMKWNQISLTESIWRIPDTKNGTPQNVTLSPEAVAILTAREEGSNSGFVFPSDGKSGHLVEPKKGWQRIFDRDEVMQLAARIEAAGEAFATIEGEDLAVTLKRARATAAELQIDTEGARLDALRIHDLRRTLGSWQAKQGASLAIIGKSLNHKSQQATAIYARLDLDPVRASVNSATTAMMKAAGLALVRDAA